MKKILVLLGLFAPAAVHAQDSGYSVARYVCDRQVEFDVTYANVAPSPISVLSVEGRQVTLELQPGGSGAKYGMSGDQPGYVWWTKGDEAMLLWGANDEEQTLLTCTRQP